MDDKLLCIPNDANQNYTFCVLNHWWKSLNSSSFGPTIEVPKVFEPMNNIRDLKG